MCRLGSRRAASSAAARAGSASTILITPATPAAACVWPRFDLIEPSHSGSSARAASDRTLPPARPPRSDRPASSRCRAPPPRRRRPGSTPLADSAVRITRCCDGPFGAVRPWLRPSWLTAEPRTTASTRSPSRSRIRQPLRAPACRSLRSSRCRRPRREALAPPVGRQPAQPAELHEQRRRGHHRARRRQAPASHSPCRSACAARCTATSDDEHAVSTVIAGPCRPSVYEIRPESTLPAWPVPT